MSARHAVKTIGRDLPDGDYIEITAEVRRDHSEGLSDGYAVTSVVWEQRGTITGRSRRLRGLDAHSAGCQHALLLSVAPELAPLVTVHLAALDGTPMHARANGWYFYSGKSTAYETRHYGEEYAQRHGTPHERAARALSIPPEDLPRDMDEAAFNAFCDTLTETWQAQAAAALRVFDSLQDGDGVEDA